MPRPGKQALNHAQHEPHAAQTCHLQDDILYIGSDDDDYIGDYKREHHYKECARNYILSDYRPPFILSATLKGPFDGDWQNPWRRKGPKAKVIEGNHIEASAICSEGRSRDTSATGCGSGRTPSLCRTTRLADARTASQTTIAVTESKPSGSQSVAAVADSPVSSDLWANAGCTTRQPKQKKRDRSDCDWLRRTDSPKRGRSGANRHATASSPSMSRARKNLQQAGSVGGGDGVSKNNDATTWSSIEPTSILSSTPSTPLTGVIHHDSVAIDLDETSGPLRASTSLRSSASARSEPSPLHNAARKPRRAADVPPFSYSVSTPEFSRRQDNSSDHNDRRVLETASQSGSVAVRTSAEASSTYELHQVKEFETQQDDSFYFRARPWPGAIEVHGGADEAFEHGVEGVVEKTLLRGTILEGAMVCGGHVPEPVVEGEIVQPAGKGGERVLKEALQEDAAEEVLPYHFSDLKAHLHASASIGVADKPPTAVVSDHIVYQNDCSDSFDPDGTTLLHASQPSEVPMLFSDIKPSIEDGQAELDATSSIVISTKEGSKRGVLPQPQRTSSCGSTASSLSSAPSLSTRGSMFSSREATPNADGGEIADSPEGVRLRLSNRQESEDSPLSSLRSGSIFSVGTATNFLTNANKGNEEGNVVNGNDCIVCPLPSMEAVATESDDGDCRTDTQLQEDEDMQKDTAPVLSSLINVGTPKLETQEQSSWGSPDGSCLDSIHIRSSHSPQTPGLPRSMDAPAGGLVVVEGHAVPTASQQSPWVPEKAESSSFAAIGEPVSPQSGHSELDSDDADGRNQTLPHLTSDNSSEWKPTHDPSSAASNSICPSTPEDRSQSSLPTPDLTLSNKPSRRFLSAPPRAEEERSFSAAPRTLSQQRRYGAALKDAWAKKRVRFAPLPGEEAENEDEEGEEAGEAGEEDGATEEEHQNNSSDTESSSEEDGNEDDDDYIEGGLSRSQKARNVARAKKVAAAVVAAPSRIANTPPAPVVPIVPVRPSSPPPPTKMALEDLPCEVVLFKNHFIKADARRRLQGGLRQIPQAPVRPVLNRASDWGFSSQQQSPSSPAVGAMAEKFVEADRGVAALGGRRGSLKRHEHPPPSARRRKPALARTYVEQAHADEPKNDDDVSAVINNLTDFFNTHDVDLEAAQMTPMMGTTKGLGAERPMSGGLFSSFGTALEFNPWGR